MAITLNASDLEGRTVLSSDGEKLGKVDDVMVDDRGMAQYVRVRSGWFGLRHHVIPVGGLDESGDDLIAMQTKAQLEAAPTFDSDEDIDYDRERTLGAHYGTPVRDWDDTRDRWLAGEDLSRGPTPETRHPGGHADDVADTTQGPTPEIRQVMRATDDDRAASGQPMADSRTRADVGGNQDLDDRITRDRDMDMGTSRDIDTAGARDTGMYDADTADLMEGERTDPRYRTTQEDLMSDDGMGGDRRMAGSRRIRLRRHGAGRPI